MVKIKSFSVEDEEIVFEDEKGSLKFTRKWIVRAKSI